MNEESNSQQEELIEEEGKPELNQARITTFGSYKALYDYKPVASAKRAPNQLEQIVWQGRPMVEPIHDKIPGARKNLEVGFIFFTREYDDRNDWDRLYHEFEFDDSLFGVPFIIVPKEKILFAYDPPPGAGIILPMPGVIKPSRGRN